MLRIEPQLQYTYYQSLMPFPGTSLAACGLKSGRYHPQRRASVTVIAVWAIGKHSAAPKPLGDKF
jgi:hypothetical protein